MGGGVGDNDFGLAETGGGDPPLRLCDRRLGESAPVTWPDGPTRAASSNTVVPLPQPISSTRSPGCGAAAVISASRSGTSTRSIRWC
jgi:hypothetical protein